MRGPTGVGGGGAGGVRPADLAGQAAALLDRLRSRRPLVHHLANFVTMQAVANVTLAVGALPVMAMAREDAEEMAAQADALVLSLGTPTPDRIEAMLAASRRAATRGIPVVLDPVGAGATRFRTAAARQVLAAAPVSVVRANRGEAGALLGRPGGVRGVESSAPESETDGAVVAAALARALGCVAAITGPTDEIADAGRAVRVRNGHPWLRAVSGAGCMATAVVGAFCAVEADRLVAAAAGLACFGVAAEAAAGAAGGPGTLTPALLDALHHLTPEQLLRTAHLEAG